LILLAKLDSSYVITVKYVRIFLQASRSSLALLNPKTRPMQALQPGTRFALRLALFYLIAGIGWIWLTDDFLFTLLDIETKTGIQLWNSYKGTLFILLTATLLFFLAQNFAKKTRRINQDYRAIFDLSPLPSLVFSPNDGRILYANRAAGDLFRRPLGDLIRPDFIQDLGLADLMPDPNSDEYWGIKEFQLQLAPKPDSFVAVRALSYQLDSRGERLQLVMLENLTQQQAAENEARLLMQQTLRLNEELLNNKAQLWDTVSERLLLQQEVEHQRGLLEGLFNSLNDPLMVIDSEYRYLWINETAKLALTAFNHGRVPQVGSVCLPDVFSGMMDKFKEVAQKALRGEITDEESYFEKDGRPYWIRAKTIPVYNAQREIIAFCFAATDNTAIREAQRREAEANLLLAALFNSSSESVTLITTDYRILWCNAAAETLLMRLFGKKPVSGVNYPDFLGPEAWSVLHPVLDLVKQGESFQYEYEVDFPDGSKSWLNTRFAPLVDTNQQLIGISAVGLDITEVKKAKEGEAEALARLEALFNSSQEAIALINPELEVTWLNNTAANVLSVLFGGVPPLGKQLRDYVVPTDWWRTEEMLAEAQAGLMSVREVQSTLPAGEIIWQQIRLFPVRNPTDEIIAYCMTGLNITEMKLAQAREAEALIRLEALFNSSQESIALVSPDFRFLWLNNQSSRLLEARSGVSPQPGDRVQDFVSPENWPHYQAQGKRALAGETITNQFELKLQNGQKVWVNARYFPVYDTTGSVIGFSSTGLDITAIRQAQAREAEAQERLRAIVNSAMDAIITVDSDLRVVIFNQAAEAVFGYQAQEVIGEPMAQLLPDHIQGSGIQLIQDFESDREFSRRITRTDPPLLAKRKSGEVFPIEASISRVEVNESSYYTIILRDITQQLEAQREIVEKQRMLDMALSAGNIGIWTFTEPKGHIELDSRLKSFLKSTSIRNQAQLDELNNRILEEDRLRRLALFKPMRYEGKPESYALEFQFQGENNQMLWIYETAHIMEKDPHGKPTKIVGTWVDITVLKNIELQKRQQQQQLIEALVQGQDQERSRISAELHDGLGQTIHATIMNYNALEFDLLNDEPLNRDLIQNIKELLAMASREIRDISHNLASSIVLERGLSQALEDLAKRLAPQGKLQIQTQLTPILPNELPEYVAVGLYRIGQELLNNVFKHAKAQKAVLRLTQTETQLILSVADNGQGFDPEMLTKASGIGMHNLQARAQLLQAETEIASTPGHGTTITLRLPLPIRSLLHSN
jgi:PAS domain S-box-containing protein